MAQGPASRNPVSDPPPEGQEVWIEFGTPRNGWRGYRIGSNYYRSTWGTDVQQPNVIGWRFADDADPAGVGVAK